MSEDKVKETCCKPEGKNMNAGAAGGGAVYGVGLIGALIYFIQHADSFVSGLVGILKALVWPAYLVYHLLAFLRL